jgi:hypothetical protein
VIPVIPVFEEITLLDGILEPIAAQPVDITDPDWMSKMRDPLEQAGIKTEVHTALRTVLELYDSGDDTVRAEIRALFDRCTSFRWAAHVPLEPTPAGFRFRLLHFSAVDQGADTRDELLGLRDLSDQAQQAGVDIRPIAAEIAVMSSDVDKYGMGSTKDILLSVAG